MSVILTDTEVETLACLAMHGNTRDTAKHLHRSTQTVRNRLSAIYLKLGVFNSIDAFRAMGWLMPRDAKIEACDGRCRPVRLENA